MRICILAEGSYPYISGGVSSWVHSLIRAMPEHEFIIYAIGAEASKKGQYRYELPDNVIEVREAFLDDYKSEAATWGKKFRLGDKGSEHFLQILRNDLQIDWASFFDTMETIKKKSSTEFLMSLNFYDMIQELALTQYSQVPFTELFWTVRSMLLPMLQLLRDDMPEADLYHSVSTGYAGLMGAYAKYQHHKPFLLTEHGIYSREREEEIIKADWVKGYFKDLWIQYFYSLSGCAYQLTDEVITLFHRNKEIEVELGCEEDKIKIIPNGVNVTFFEDIAPPTEEDRQFINIGAFIRVVPIKDIKTMLHSFQVVQREVPNARFYVMGPYEEDLQYYDECLQLAKSLDLQNVIFTGQIPIKAYMGRMDILTLTSISEGQPLALLEGMAAGKPFVTTDVGSCKELIYGKDDPYGPAGMVAPVMHYEQIGQALIELCRNPELRTQYGLNGLNRVKSNYTMDSFISQYKALYQQLGG
ncbi:GT4 family glycosyltransferase PelF [Marinicrinis sediminis]|uniref:GT4 family glycosyltransferase PelF n=1 Tax=Marinicrinis sediminis TaxID=1652465 RepID=A0ABW5R775_9BACL